MAILEPGITKCAFKKCEVEMKLELGYVKAINPETNKEEFFCNECYKEKQSEIVRSMRDFFFLSGRK